MISNLAASTGSSQLLLEARMNQDRQSWHSQVEELTVTKGGNWVWTEGRAANEQRANDP